MNFIDFQIRAWQADANHVQVIVHSSPAGDMRKPTTVKCDLAQLRSACRVVLQRPSGLYVQSAIRQSAIKVGRQLAKIILPDPIYTLLTHSLERIAPEDGIRLRLCLDEALMDFPWEFLYRPGISRLESLAEFLVLDARISLVRGAPTTWLTLEPSDQRQRLVFAGMLQYGDADRQQTKVEYQQLAEALQPVDQFLSTEYVTAADDHIAVALVRPAAIFHYGGYTVTEAGQGFLIRDMPSSSEYDRLPSERMGDLLRRAQTKLAFFNALNSSRWTFIEPMVRAGIPALIGMHGAPSIPVAIAFARKLYASLAIGLSLDEAVTWARLHLLETSTGLDENAWGQFAVYMPAAKGVLLPRPPDQAIRTQQEAARYERQQTIINVYQIIGTVQGGQVVGVSAGQKGGGET